MAVAGFAVMNPVATMAMVDTARWRPVVYADTPKTLSRYQSFLGSKSDQRKVVCFVFGATYLPDVLKNKDKIASYLVFDDLQNLHLLTAQLPGFDIVDITRDNGVFPKYLSPQELTVVLEAPTKLPDQNLLLKKVTDALGARKPSVLETTSRIPQAETIQESGAQRRLTEIKRRLTSGPDFSVVLDYYVKYLFRIVDRNQVTQNVTKKLPAELKDLWKEALDFADSEIGLTMAKAYASLCFAADPDYRVGHAVAKHSLKPYGGDFSYFTAVLPPHNSCAFIPGVLENTSAEETALVALFKVKPVEAKASKPAAKKPKGKS